MNIALTLLFCLISLSEAFDVDGYKDFKFGMSKGEVESSDRLSVRDPENVKALRRILFRTGDHPDP